MEGENGWYRYKPSHAMAVLAVCLFGTSAAFNTYKMIRTRTWYHLCLVVGSWMMTLGYIFRFISSYHPSNLAFYVLQSLLIILPPSLYAATVYMIYKRLCLSLPSLLSTHLIPPVLTTRVFVTGDLFAFTLQLAGGTMMTQVAQPTIATAGEKIMLLGLTIQLVFFLVFFLVACHFLHFSSYLTNANTSPQQPTSTPSSSLYSTDKIPPIASTSNPNTDSTKCQFDWSGRVRGKWKMLLYWLLFVAVVVIARCAFRIMEIAMGNFGFFYKREVWLYVFDMVPMLVVQVGCGLLFAGDILGSRGGENGGGNQEGKAMRIDEECAGITDRLSPGTEVMKGI